MSTQKKVTIGLISAIIVGIGYNIYAIKSGNSNTALLGGVVPTAVGVLIGFYLFQFNKHRRKQ